MTELDSQATTQGSADDDDDDDHGKRESDGTPKKVRKRLLRNGTGMSPAKMKLLRVDETRVLCGKHYNNAVLWMIHKFSKCKGKSDTVMEENLIVSDFVKLNNCFGACVQLVCYVLTIFTPISIGKDRYLFKMAVSDVNGIRRTMTWFLSTQSASKAMGIVQRVSAKPLWHVALTMLHNVLLRPVVVNSVKVVKTESRWANPGNMSLTMDHETTITPLDLKGPEVQRLRPLPGAWGSADRPLATVVNDLESLTFGTKYTFLALVETAAIGPKTWSHTWDGRDVTTAMVRGKVLVYNGVTEGEVVLKRLTWLVFVQTKPKKRAPWFV